MLTADTELKNVDSTATVSWAADVVKRTPGAKKNYAVAQATGKVNDVYINPKFEAKFEQLYCLLY